MAFTQNELSAEIRRILDAYDVPGAAVSLCRRGTPIYRSCFGVKSLRTGEPVLDSSTFDIGSVSKTFNAAAVAILVEEGKLAWNTPVMDVLPGFRLSQEALTPYVQVQDLVGQSVGWGEDNITNYSSHFTRAEIVEQIRYLPLRAQFRQQCAYQQFGPVAAATIVERLSGQTWEDFIEERIVAPLGLRETYGSIDRLPDPSVACDPHMDIGGGVMTDFPHRDFRNLGPAGAVVSSLRDMEVWFSVFACGGALGERCILSPSTVERMHTPNVPIRRDGIRPMMALPNFEATIQCYGLGWYVHDFRGFRVNQHGGALEGFLVVGAVVPAEELSVVVLTNQHQCPAIHSIKYLLLAHGLGFEQEDWDGRFRAVPGREGRAPVMVDGEYYFWRPQGQAAGTAPSNPLGAYSGDFRHPGFGIIPVRENDGALTIDILGNPCRVDHWHYDLFRAVPLDPPIASYHPEIFFSFEPDSAGSWTRLVIPTIGEFLRT